jgi:simple sugar transport system ATP-binding protein
MQYSDCVATWESHATTTTQESTRQDLAKLMVGREVILKLNKPVAAVGVTVLEVRGIVVQDERQLRAVRMCRLCCAQVKF